MLRPFRSGAILVLALSLPLTGCLFRSRRVVRQVSTAPLLNATQQQLIEQINAQAANIKTLNATVDIDTSVGGSTKGKITEYQQIRGYVLLRQPGMLRMIGLMPIVRNRAFDMVSNGGEFKLWVPPRNKFIVGRNDVTHPAAKPSLENIRPQSIEEALLVRAIDPNNEIAVMENGTETVIDPKTHKQVDQADYELEVIRRGEHGWYLSRKIIFSRTDLQPDRQIIYDQNGWVATDARYEGFKDYNGILFPSQIQIWRPQEEYSITLTMVKLQLNKPLSDEQFALQQPPGAQVVNLDQSGQGSQLRARDGDPPK